MNRQPPGKLLIPAAILLLGTTACAAATPQTAFNPHSDYAIVGLDLFQTIIVMGVVVGVLVEGVLIWAVIRYRRRSNLHFRHRSTAILSSRPCGPLARSW
jgi:heme/copper-type cytochrome/quinol oxidase subunit 2